MDKKKFFIIKIDESDDLMVHINKVKALPNQLAIIKRSIDKYNIIISLIIILFKY